jgi:hypothetical protein
MPKNMTEFLAMMDERLWFRMVVCFLPTLVIVKLVGYIDGGSLVNKVSTGVLLIGVALYVFWGRIRGWSGAENDDASQDNAASDVELAADTANADVPGHVQVEMLAELRSLCHEVESESYRLIAVEIAVNQKLSYAEATQSAIARKRIVDK